MASHTWSAYAQNPEEPPLTLPTPGLSTSNPLRSPTDCLQHSSLHLALLLHDKMAQVATPKPAKTGHMLAISLLHF